MGMLKGKVALVLGGSSGLGLAIAEQLAAEGARVIIAARRKVELDRAAERIGATAIACDLTSDASLAALAREIKQRFDRLDIAVNSAGYEDRAPLRDLVPEKLEPMVAVQFTGATYFIRHAASLMGRGGSIVTLSSLTGTLVAEDYAAYAGAKAGIEHVTRIAAAEYGPQGIRVNTVAPSLIETPLTAHLLEIPAVRAAFIDETPLGRLGTVKEVADAVLWLVSDRASFVTGQNILVDGGASLRRLPTREDVMRRMREAQGAPSSVRAEESPSIIAEIAAPADTVWKLLENFGDLSWVPGVSHVDLVGEGVGAVRRMHGAEGSAPLEERLERLDPEKRTLTYSISGKNPLQVREYSATMTVHAVGPETSRLEWTSTFEPDGTTRAQAVTSVRGLYRVCVDGIRRALGVAAPIEARDGAKPRLAPDVTIRTAFLENVAPRINERPARLQDFEGKKLLFDITGAEAGRYCFWFKDGRLAVLEGDPGDATATISMDSGDYRQLVNGELDGATAYLGGRLKITGDLGLAMQLQTLMN